MGAIAAQLVNALAIRGERVEAILLIWLK